MSAAPTERPVPTVVVINHLPGRPRQVAYRGRPLPAATVRRLKDVAKEQRGKAEVFVDGTKMTNLAQYIRTTGEPVRRGTPTGAVGRPVTQVLTGEQLTPEIYGHAQRLYARTFTQARIINWSRFFAAMNQVILDDGSRLEIAPSAAVARRRLSNYVRSLKAEKEKRERDQAAQAS